jgi:spermidine/putrescine transport system ATP-binding protein
MSDVNAVELVGVVKKFSDVTAVDRVNLQIKDGEFFSLLGPSGCGKTTTLRLVAGFELPTAGDVYICGKLQGYLPANQRPVNTVFQNYALFPHMNVFKNVSFGLEMKKVSQKDIRTRVGEVLEMVQLRGMERRKPRQLSGGQQQRVALARALVNHPKVLLLDEPLGALDLKLRKEMQVELKSLQEKVGITFIYVTHDQEEALTMSDRLAVMSKGKLLQIGTPQQVYEAPECRFVADFIGESNYLPGRVLTLKDGQAEILVEPRIHLWALAPPGISPGMQVNLAFRPEKAQLNPVQGEEHNTVQACIQDVIYTGSATSYYLRLENNALIKVVQQNNAVGNGFIRQMGENVTVCWPVQASTVFTSD